MTIYLENDAVISDCEKYRYLLRRTWDHDLSRVLIVMLNPSTADARKDDATIRSCVRLCKDHRAGSFEVVNLFGFRATDPTLLDSVADPVGPNNDQVIEAAVNRCDQIICAWGANAHAVKRERAALDLLGGHRPAIFCWGRTASGAPRHPLYIKSGTPLIVYR